MRLLDELWAHELLLSESGIVGGKAKPDVVELGDLVTIEFVVAHGLRRRRTVERYLLVPPAEARLDRLRISVDSPLGRAVLGQPVGTHVKVRTRSSRYTARVVATEGAPPLAGDLSAEA